MLIAWRLLFSGDDLRVWTVGNNRRVVLTGRRFVTGRYSQMVRSRLKAECNTTQSILTGSINSGIKKSGGCMKDGNNQRKVNTNPRSQNGTLRRKYRARFKAMGAPCGICGGRLGPIHYDEPSDAAHPLSFVIDEIIPISRHKEFGYKSRRQAAEDWNNLQAAHYICNSRKGAKTQSELKTLTENRSRQMLINLSDGNW